jgi:hypothetical protein
MSVWDFFVWFFWFYIIITCISIFIRVIIDVFRDPELSGWAKALWTLFLIVVPFLAAFIYLIARGGRMAQRSAAGSRQAEAANVRARIRRRARSSPASASSTAGRSRPQSSRR